MCICLIQFQHNSYPCNTPRTLAYGYMRYKLGVWLKIIGVSISIIFHKIDSRGKKCTSKTTTHCKMRVEKYHSCIHTHIHTALCRPDEVPCVHIPRWTPNTAGFLSVASQPCSVWPAARIRGLREATCDVWAKEQPNLLETKNQNWDPVTMISQSHLGWFSQSFFKMTLKNNFEDWVRKCHKFLDT